MRRVLPLLLLLMPACGDQDASDSEESAADGDMCAPVTETVTPPEGATLEFMAECVPGQDSQCKTGTCFDFTSRGPHCTAACTQACECPPPSGGCSNRGVCKAPGG